MRSPGDETVSSRSAIGSMVLIGLALSFGALVAPTGATTTPASLPVVNTRHIVGFNATSKKPSRPRIARFYANPMHLGSSGGTVYLNAIVSRASECRFASANLHFARTLPCSHGSRRITIKISDNASTDAMTYRFDLVARTGSLTRSRVLSVVEDGRAVLPTEPDAPPSSPAFTPAVPTNTPPVVTLDPSDVTVTAGTEVTFEAAASGTPTPSLQWLLSMNGGVTWSAVPGATSTSYSRTADVLDTGDEFEATFTNSAGSATTAAATLTVTAGSVPTVTVQPVDDTTLAGTSAMFDATSSGTPAPTVQWEVSTNGGSSWQSIPGATSSCYAFVAASSANDNEFQAVFTNAAGVTTSSPATLTVTSSPNTSSNWAGYVATDPCGTFDTVSASWTVPKVTCTSGTQYSVQWVGIDGSTSSTVEQDGTEADCQSGAASYGAWYEMFGDPNVNNGYEVELDPTTYPVKPDDVVTASVNESGGVWTLTVADSTESWNFSTNVNFASAARSSAEWILERPETCAGTCKLTALADFGTSSFSSCQARAGATSGSISAFTGDQLDMTGNTDALLAESETLSETGQAFSVAWNESGP
jgi:hypothetical protein